MLEAGGSVITLWLGVLRRRWLPAAGIAGLVFGLAAAMVFMARPVYRADAKLRLGEPPPMSGVSPNAGFFGLLRMGGDPFANDLELLESRTLAEGVVDDAALNVKVRAPRGWHRDSLFQGLAAGRDTDKAAFDVTWREDGGVLLRQVAPRESTIGTFPAGAEVTAGGLRFTPRPWRVGMPRTVRLSTLPFGEAVRRAEQQIGVERARRDANVVVLSYAFPDPGLARAVVAAVVRRFVELRTAIQRRESGETVDSLRAVSSQTLAELRAAEAELESLQREGRLIAPDAQSEAFIERYSRAVSDLERVRSQLGALASALDRAGDVEEAADAWTALLAYPEFLENATLGDLLTRLTTLEAKRTELAPRRTEANAELAAVVKQIAYLDRSLRSVASGYRQTLREQEETLRARVAAMDAELGRMPARIIELARRQRDARILSEVFVLTEQRLRQEELRQALTFANIQVIDPPALRFKPVWPRKKLGLAVGLMLAAIFGALAVAVTEHADPAVRGGRELRAALGAPVLLALAGGRPEVAPHELRAVLARAGVDDRGRPRLTVAAVDDEAAAHDVARALLEGGARAGGERAGTAAADALIVTTPHLASFAAAAEAAAHGAPVAVVAVLGRTPLDALRRSATLLAEAGAEVAGAVVLCASERDAEAVWS